MRFGNARCCRTSYAPRAGNSQFVFLWFINPSIVIRPPMDVFTVMDDPISASVVITLTIRLTAVLFSVPSGGNSDGMIVFPSERLSDYILSTNSKCNGTTSLSEQKWTRMQRSINVFPSRMWTANFRLRRNQYGLFNLIFKRSVGYLSQHISIASWLFGALALAIAEFLLSIAVVGMRNWADSVLVSCLPDTLLAPWRPCLVRYWSDSVHIFRKESKFIWL